MAKKTGLERRLRRKLTRLLAKPRGMGPAVSILKDWESQGLGPILFGGIVRDLVVFGRRKYPRDVDVVLQHGEIESIVKDLHDNQYNRNRFGGLHLSINKWAFDVWPLEKTWAFTQYNELNATAHDLPKTTFLDVEAIAITFNGPDRIGQIISNGFFEAIEERCISINHRENPFPGLSAVRAIVTASKLQFAISADLARYFVNVVSELGVAELVRAQESHYGKVLFIGQELQQLADYFNAKVQANQHSRIWLPDKYQPKQLQLWPSI